MADHIVPTRVYFTIFGILMLCTGATVAIAFFDLGPLNTVAALGIAVFKATIVVLFFMHVKYSTRLTWAVVLGSVFWLGILLTLTMSDYLTPAWQTYGDAPSRGSAHRPGFVPRRRHRLQQQVLVEQRRGAGAGDRRDPVHPVKLPV